MEPVSPELRDALNRTVSPARLAPYMEAAGFNHDRAIRLYLWNVMVGQSFHFPLQAAEVAIRNSIKAVFCRDWGAKWWRTSIAQTFLDERAIEDLKEARK